MEYPQSTLIKAVVSYIPIIGVILFFVDRDDAYIHFHAAQSIVAWLFNIIANIALGLLSWIPVLGFVFGFASVIVWIALLLFCLLCMLKAWQGEQYRIPVLGVWAEKLAARF